MASVQLMKKFTSVYGLNTRILKTLTISQFTVVIWKKSQMAIQFKASWSVSSSNLDTGI